MLSVPVQRVLDLKGERLALSAAEHNRYFQLAAEQQARSGIQGPDAARSYLVKFYFDHFRKRIGEYYDGAKSAISIAESTADLDAILDYVDGVVRVFRDDLARRIKVISPKPFSRTEPDVIAVYKNLHREFETAATIAVARRREQLGPMRRKNEKKPAQLPGQSNQLSVLQKLAKAIGGLSGILSPEEFDLFEELEASGYIVGQIGPDTHDSDDYMVDKVKLTANGRILMEELQDRLTAAKAAARPVARPLDPKSKDTITMKIFISHSSQDEEFASAVVKLLRAALSLPPKAIRCTSVPGYKLPLGASTDSQLKNEVNGSRVFVALLTPTSMTSPYVLFEMGARWGQGLFLGPLIGKGATMKGLGPVSGINALDAAICTS